MENDLKLEVVSLAEVPINSSTAIHSDLPLVMVVEDDIMLADTRSEILARAGLSVIKAYDAATALELAMCSPPDLLLSNANLFDMSGVDLGLAMQKFAPCRVILLASTGPQPLLAKARQAGYDFDVLTMPVPPEELIEMVFDSLEVQQQRSRLPVAPAMDRLPALWSEASPLMA